MGAALGGDFHFRRRGRGPARSCFDFRHRRFGAGRARRPSSTAPSARLMRSRPRSTAASPSRWSGSALSSPTAPTSSMSAARDRSRSAASSRRRSRSTAASPACRRVCRLCIPLLAADDRRHDLGSNRRRPEDQSRHQRSDQHAAAVVHRRLAGCIGACSRRHCCASR